MLEIKINLKNISFLILTILLAPSAFAYGRTGVGILDSGIETISNIFHINVLRNNAYVQEGFLKMMLFIVLFAVSFSALNLAGGVFNRRTSGIVSFAFSAIGVFLMPTQWLLATGGMITAVMSSFVFVLIFGGGIYAALFILQGPCPREFMGLLLILLLLMLIDAWAIFTNIPL